MLRDVGNFTTYAHKDDPVFARPPPVQQLPVGPEYITEQFMLSTVHIDEASLEGNAKVLDEFFKQVSIYRFSYREFCDLACAYVTVRPRYSRA